MHVGKDEILSLQTYKYQIDYCLIFIDSCSHFQLETFMFVLKYKTHNKMCLSGKPLYWNHIIKICLIHVLIKSPFWWNCVSLQSQMGFRTCSGLSKQTPLFYLLISSSHNYRHGSWLLYRSLYQRQYRLLKSELSLPDEYIQDAYYRYSCCICWI